jgi:hypothetical protein
VTGLNQQLDLKKILKAIKKEHCCNGTVLKDEDTKEEVLQFQGDQREAVKSFLIKEEISDKDTVKVMQKHSHGAAAPHWIQLQFLARDLHHSLIQQAKIRLLTTSHPPLTHPPLASAWCRSTVSKRTNRCCLLLHVPPIKVAQCREVHDPIGLLSCPRRQLGHGGQRSIRSRRRALLARPPCGRGGDLLAGTGRTAGGGHVLDRRPRKRGAVDVSLIPGEPATDPAGRVAPLLRTQVGLQFTSSTSRECL